MKPLIGITSNRFKFNQTGPGPSLIGSLSADDYAGGVECADGIPVIVPLVENESTLLELAEKLDGLILSGGDDIDPATYAEEPQIGLGEVHPERDWLEIALTRVCLRQGKPVFGICRGLQVMNVALGGTVYQDIGRQWHGSIQHSQRAPRHHLTHTVRLEPGSQLSALLEDLTVVRTNSFHHQAARTVAPDLVATAWDTEGLIEGIESKVYRFAVGVQWHPENLWRAHPLFLGLFRGLVAAAAQKTDNG